MPGIIAMMSQWWVLLGLERAPLVGQGPRLSLQGETTSPSATSKSLEAQPTKLLLIRSHTQNRIEGAIVHQFISSL